MPVFNFFCHDCEESFEDLVQGKKETADCPKCGKDVQKQFTPVKTSPRFIGPGFYATDNPNNLIDR